jgi:hypothetical protein
VQVDSRNPHVSAPSPTESGTTIGLGLLYSYEHMGMGSVTCVSGCTCGNPAKVFDAHWIQRISNNNWVYFGVSQAENCIIEVQNLDNTTSGEHKLKVTGLAVLPFSSKEKGRFAQILE